MFKFSKSSRLLNRHEFDCVFNEGKKIATSHFLVFYKQTSLNQARLGLAITKKKIPKAHDRNRVKRLIRERFRSYPLKGLDIVVVLKRAILKETNPVLTHQLDKVWDALTKH